MLPNAFFYPVLRKPDFQRETADWDPQKITDFLWSFLNGDLVPAIILWDSGHYIFVVDGAHRLSTLIAWVHNDYGHGSISRSFFEQRIPDEQLEIAERTRRLYMAETDYEAVDTTAIEIVDVEFEYDLEDASQITIEEIDFQSPDIEVDCSQLVDEPLAYHGARVG